MLVKSQTTCTCKNFALSIYKYNYWYYNFNFCFCFKNSLWVSLIKTLSLVWKRFYLNQQRFSVEVCKFNFLRWYKRSDLAYFSFFCYVYNVDENMTLNSLQKTKPIWPIAFPRQRKYLYLSIVTRLGGRKQTNTGYRFVKTEMTSLSCLRKGVGFDN